MNEFSHIPIGDDAKRHPISRKCMRALMLIAPVFLALASMITVDNSLARRLEHLALDWRFQTRDKALPRQDIVIVEVDEESRRQLREEDRRFNIREHLPLAIDRIMEAGALAVGLDVLLDARTSDDLDQPLADVISKSNIVLAVTHTEGKLNRPIESFLESSPAEGCISVYPDEDGVLRRLPPELYLDVVNADGTLSTIPHFPLSLALYGILEEEQVETIEFNEIGARIGTRFIRSAETIDYVGTKGDGWRTLKYADVVAGNFDNDMLEGTVVILGESRMIADQFALPIGPPTSPGIYYHANVVAQLLDNRHLNTKWMENQRSSLLVGGLTLLSGFLAWHQRRWWEYKRGSMLLAAYILGLLTLFGAGWVLLSLAMFTRNVVLPLPTPVLCIFVSLASGFAAQLVVTSMNSRRLLESSRQIEALFSRNVSRSVLDTLKRNPEQVMETRQCEASILFCDLRGFSTLSTDMSPKKVAELLNEYFNTIADAVLENNGFIDKFVGDEIMAVFSVPLEQKDHALRAVRTALAIKSKLRGLNNKRRQESKSLLECGIGIHTGEVAAGHIGSAERSNFTVVGTTVNIAARIEELTRGGEILVSDTVESRASADAAMSYWKTVTLRGLDKPVKLYSVKEEALA